METRERLLTPGEVASLFRVDPKTVTRWADEGFCGLRLERYRIGKKRFSTKQAARRFLAAVNGDAWEASVPVTI